MQVTPSEDTQVYKRELIRLFEYQADAPSIIMKAIESGLVFGNLSEIEETGLSEAIIGSGCILAHCGNIKESLDYDIKENRLHTYREVMHEPDIKNNIYITKVENYIMYCVPPQTHETSSKLKFVYDVCKEYLESKNQ